jgi:hypothetical protein
VSLGGKYAGMSHDGAQQAPGSGKNLEKLRRVQIMIIEMLKFSTNYDVQRIFSKSFCNRRDSRKGIQLSPYIVAAMIKII